jgi:hypothetical protein
MVRRARRAQSEAMMMAERSVHLCTDRGTALCGVQETLHLSSLEASVTCLECRAFIALKAIERNLTERRLAATIARLTLRRS